MKKSLSLAVMMFLVYLLVGIAIAVPVEPTIQAPDNSSSEGISKLNTAEVNATNIEQSKSNANSSDTVELVAAESQSQNFVGTVGSTILMPDHSAKPAQYDTTPIYAGLVSPEAFQQYVNQFGGTYAPYATAAATGDYTAPAIYPFPGPYVVQTGYEGYLVPANSATAGAESDDTTSQNANAPNNSLINPNTLMSNLISALMMSTAFRIVAAIISTLAMIFFGSAVTTAVCNMTPICDISRKTVSYLRGRGADDVGRIIVEEMTPERVRRATEFVRNAIRKYRQLQKVMDLGTEKTD